jgi:hypothetical protein
MVNDGDERGFEVIGDIALRVLADIEKAMKEDAGGLRVMGSQRPDRPPASGEDTIPLRFTVPVLDNAHRITETGNAGRVQYGPHQPAGSSNAPSSPPPVVRLRSRRRNAITHANDNVRHMRLAE